MNDFLHTMSYLDTHKRKHSKPQSFRMPRRGQENQSMRHCELEGCLTPPLRIPHKIRGGVPISAEACNTQEGQGVPGCQHSPAREVSSQFWLLLKTPLILKQLKYGGPRSKTSDSAPCKSSPDSLDPGTHFPRISTHRHLLMPTLEEPANQGSRM